MILILIVSIKSYFFYKKMKIFFITVYKTHKIKIFVKLVWKWIKICGIFFVAKTNVFDTKT